MRFAIFDQIARSTWSPSTSHRRWLPPASPQRCGLVRVKLDRLGLINGPFPVSIEYELRKGRREVDTYLRRELS